ncbi:SgcJ/EcaC family oxidoreductase [Granulicella arctica]|uniref:SgcJ/EcaC family oxidoreductase n=1 Tax=Granulicella arctica TaxID=940613 RepID=UPI0021E063E5|nr:SgcJ/EcaC family oxidoreductase [Granulicella arctica]
MISIMIKLRLFSLGVFLIAGTLTIAAQSSGDDQAVRTFFANADIAWNNHDARQLTNLQNATVDADFINVYGGWAKGMEPFVAIMTKLQAGPFHDVHRQTTVEKIRFIRDDVAVVITTIVDRHGGGPPASTRGIFVLSKEQGHWLLNSFQNTQITSPPERAQVPQTPASSPH